MSKRRELEQAQRDRMLSTLKVGSLVKVDSFNSEKMTVNVQPISKWENQGNWETPPPILAVPVACFQGGDLIIAPNFQTGDVGVLLYIDHDIDTAADKGSLTNPNTNRKHSSDDAVFVGGIVTQGKTFKKPVDDAVTISALDGSVYFALTKDGIKIKADIEVEGNITVNSGDVIADGISLKTHTHGGVMTGGSNTDKPN